MRAVFSCCLVDMNDDIVSTQRRGPPRSLRGWTHIWNREPAKEVVDVSKHVRVEHNRNPDSKFIPIVMINLTY